MWHGWRYSLPHPLNVLFRALRARSPVGWVEPQAKPNVLRSESKPLSSSRTRGSSISSRTRWWPKPPSFPRRRRSDDSESRILCRASIFAAAFITAGAERFVSRLTREFLLSVDTKETKRSAPTLAFRCAPGPLPPSPLRGHGETGHPWPDTPFAAPGRSTPCASTPLGLR